MMDERTNLPRTAGAADPDESTADPSHAAPRRIGGAPVVLAARGLVAYELAQWPDGDAKELQLAVERLAVQGRQLAFSIEALIVELKQLCDRRIAAGRPEYERRALREHIVSTLIDAYYRAAP